MILRYSNVGEIRIFEARMIFYSFVNKNAY